MQWSVFRFVAIFHDFGPKSSCLIAIVCKNRGTLPGSPDQWSAKLHEPRIGRQKLDLVHHIAIDEKLKTRWKFFHMHAPDSSYGSLKFQQNSKFLIFFQTIAVNDTVNHLTCSWQHSTQNLTGFIFVTRTFLLTTLVHTKSVTKCVGVIFDRFFGTFFVLNNYQPIWNSQLLHILKVH